MMSDGVRPIQSGRFGTFHYDPKRDRYEFDDDAVGLLGGTVGPETRYPDILQHIPRALRKPYEEWRINTIESGRPGAVRIPFDLPNGQITLQVHLRRREQVVHGILVDVTEDEELHRSRETQLRVMNFAERIALFGTWAYDIEADSFTASQGAIDLMLPGADPATFTFERVLELVHADDRDTLREAYQRALETGQVQNVEFRAVQEPRWYTIQFMRILDHEGEAAYTCGLIHETTDLHAKTKWKEEYQRVQGLHELRARFVNAAAHELNQPLTPMRLELAMLKGRLPGDEDVMRAFRVIKRNVDRLEFMLRDLLDAARSQAGQLRIELQSVDLGEHIEHVVQTLRPMAAERQVQIHWEPDDLPLAEADPMRVEQCVSNLIHNAVKFTEAGTEVTVHATAEAAHVRVSVHDHGPGMSKTQQGLLFEPFAQIHASPANYRGTGLGLYVTHALMQAMQGDIEVESAPGRGSTFHLLFAQSRPPAA